MKADAFRHFSNPSRFNNHHAVPEYLSKAQTAKVYDAGVQNRTAPQTICSCDPLRVCYFGDADDAACLQFACTNSTLATSLTINVRGGVD
jgi:hypothetical protein